MADVLRLANASQGTTVNLKSGTLKLRHGSWKPRTPAVENEYTHVPFGAQTSFKHYAVVVETLDLVGDAGFSASITGIQAIEDVLEGARRWHSDLSTKESQWIEWNVDGETAKRSLIYEGSIQYPGVAGGGMFSSMLDDGQLLARLNISRHPLWESTSTGSQNSNVSCLGGQMAISSVAGTVPARIRTATVEGVNLGGGPIYKFWMGIREENEGTSGFVSVLECESGYDSPEGYAYHHNFAGTNRWSEQDNDCSPGGVDTGWKASIRFDGDDDPAMLLRVTVKLGDIDDATSAHYVGRYLVVARARADTGTTCLMQLRAGMFSYHDTDPNLTKMGEYVEVSSDEWHLYPMGHVLIPGTGYWYGFYGSLDRFAIGIDAERVDGSGNLDIDCLMLIPSTHLVYCEGSLIHYSLGDNQPVKVWTLENDIQFALSHTSNNPQQDVETAFASWYLPTGNSVLVLAGDRDEGDEQDIDDTVKVTLSYYNRWLSYADQV